MTWNDTEMNERERRRDMEYLGALLNSALDARTGDIESMRRYQRDLCIALHEALHLLDCDSIHGILQAYDEVVG